jgi:hypothetical protein
VLAVLRIRVVVCQDITPCSLIGVGSEISEEPSGSVCGAGFQNEALSWYSHTRLQGVITHIKGQVKWEKFKWELRKKFLYSEWKKDAKKDIRLEVKEEGLLDDPEQDSFFLILKHIRKLKWKDGGKVEGNEDVASIDLYQVEMVLAEQKCSCSFSVYMK